MTSPGKHIFIYFSDAVHSIKSHYPCQLFQLLTCNSIRNEILLEGVLKKCFIFIIWKILFPANLWGNLFTDILFFHSFVSNTGRFSCQSLIFLPLFGSRQSSADFISPSSQWTSLRWLSQGHTRGLCPNPYFTKQPQEWEGPLLGFD